MLMLGAQAHVTVRPSLKRASASASVLDHDVYSLLIQVQLRPDKEREFEMQVCQRGKSCRLFASLSSALGLVVRQATKPKRLSHFEKNIRRGKLPL